MTEHDERAAIEPGADAVLEARVLKQLTAAGETGVRKEQAGGLLPKEAPLGVAERALERLEERGEAVYLEGHWIALSRTDLAIGVLEVLEGGDARLRPEGAGMEASHFISRRHRRGGITGDRVLVEPVSSRPSAGRAEERDSRRGGGARRGKERGSGARRGRPPRELPRAAVVRVLGAPRRLVGRVEKLRDGQAWVQPFDFRLPFDVLLEEDAGVAVGDYVVLELARGRRAERVPRGRLIENLGSLEVPGTDARVILRHFAIPEVFPAAALAEADALGDHPGEADMKGRLDLRGQTVFTIDGASARDFDDAVSYRKLGPDRHELGIHIASVASYVAPSSALDAEAYRRGTSVYFPEGSVPMLPESLSSGLCSLRPNEPRLTLSVFLEVDDAARVMGSRFAESVIESTHRLTYEEARRMLEEPDAGDAARYGETLTALTALERISRALTELRRARGSLEFDLPLADLILDESGRMEEVRTGRRNVAHRIIEELMIAANEAVARELASAQAGCLFRVHEPPRLGSLQELAESVELFGLKLDVEAAARAPSALRALLMAEAGRPEEAFVAGLVLRALQRALYRPENMGHYALASENYLHFTSPIRRYPDLVVHRALIALLRAGRGSSRAELRGGREGDEALMLERMGEMTSSTERRAERAERDLRQWKLTRFLADRVGETFNGRISGVTDFGLFVELDEVPVSGLLHVADMGDDYFTYDAAAHRLVGRQGGAEYRLGDAIEVRLTAVDERRRGLNLAMAGPEPRRPRQGPKKGNGPKKGSRPARRPGSKPAGKGAGSKSKPRRPGRG